MNRLLQTILTLILLVGLTYVMHQQNQMIIPVKLINQQNVTLIKLQSIGIDSEKIANSVNVASQQSGLSTDFLIALMITESNGNTKAVSNKGYKGLMQIPYAVYYADANLLIGAHIFNEKLKIANGNLVKAIMLYKGYPLDSDRGVQQARKVIALRDRLRKIEV